MDINKYFNEVDKKLNNLSDEELENILMKVEIKSCNICKCQNCKEINCSKYHCLNCGQTDSTTCTKEYLEFYGQEFNDDLFKDSVMKLIEMSGEEED